MLYRQLVPKNASEVTERENWIWKVSDCGLGCKTNESFNQLTTLPRVRSPLVRLLDNKHPNSLKRPTSLSTLSAHYSDSLQQTDPLTFHRSIVYISNPCSLWIISSTNLNSSSTACGNVWKLLFLLMYVPSTNAILPNICRQNKTLFQ